MHAVLWRHHVTDPVRRDEVVGRVQAGLIPLLASLQGIMQLWVIAPEDDEVMCIAFFSEALHAQACTATANAWVEQSLGPLLTGPSEVALGEVKSFASAMGH